MENIFWIVLIICLTVMFVAEKYFEYKIEKERNKNDG